MSLRALLLIGAVALAAPAVLSAQELVLEAGSSVWLSGDSNLHAFESTATVIDFAATYDPAPPESLKALTLEIPVSGLRSDSKSLDGNLKKALKHKEAPVIRFEMTGYSSVPGTSGVRNATLLGRLTLAGVTREIYVDGVVRRGPGGLSAVGEKELKMSDFGIKPPTMLLGTLRVKDRVVVHFDLKTGLKEKGR